MISKITPCKFCGRTFKTKQGLTSHENQCPSNPNKRIKVFERLPCKFCGKECLGKSALTHHENICLENPNRKTAKLHKCEKCNKEFKGKNGLVAHQRTCGKEKTIPCKFCGELFTTTRTRDIHQKSCSKNPQSNIINCRYCGMGCSGKSGLVQHERHCKYNPDGVEMPARACIHCGTLIKNSNHENLYCRENPNLTFKKSIHKVSPRASFKEKSFHKFISIAIGGNTPVTTMSLGRFEFDVMVEKYKLLFEFNGTYWHSRFGNNKQHAFKTKLAEENGYKLFHVSEFDWNHPIRGQIWRSMIKNALHQPERKIAARKLEFREFKNSDARTFLEENHMQGFRPAKKAYGLFLGEELISMMNFSFNTKYQCQELIRFSTKMGVMVVGGANKLWKNIQKETPMDVISYARRDWSSTLNNVYQRLGFEYLSDTGPGYQYVNPSKMSNDWSLEPLSRQTFQKHKLLEMINEGILVKPDGDIITEKTITEANGYYKFYDAGNLIYKYKALY